MPASRGGGIGIGGCKHKKLLYSVAERYAECIKRKKLLYSVEKRTAAGCKRKKLLYSLAERYEG